MPARKETSRLLKWTPSSLSSIDAVGSSENSLNTMLNKITIRREVTKSLIASSMHAN